MKRLSLEAASWLFLAGWLIHNADHMRRGLSAVREGVVWGGTLVAMLAVVVWTLVFTRNERAPLAAAVIGPSIAFGVMAAHLLPDWGALSDSLIDGDVDAFTWVAVLSEVVTGFALGWAGLDVLRSHDYSLAVPATSW